jgi:hypothetical protein
MVLRWKRQQESYCNQPYDWIWISHNKIFRWKKQGLFQIGVSGNKTGISVYILGLKDKKHLAKTYGKKLGKASVSGYCIRFKALKDLNMGMLEAAIRDGLAAQDEKGKRMK